MIEGYSTYGFSTIFQIEWKKRIITENLNRFLFSENISLLTVFVKKRILHKNFAKASGDLKHYRIKVLTSLGIL